MSKTIHDYTDEELMDMHTLIRVVQVHTILLTKFSEWSNDLERRIAALEEERKLH